MFNQEVSISKGRRAKHGEEAPAIAFIASLCEILFSFYFCLSRPDSEIFNVSLSVFVPGLDDHTAELLNVWKIRAYCFMIAQ